MKERNNKELIEHMVDTLRDHSVPYKEGAWEMFAASQGKGRKINPLWYLSGAAAMVLLGVALLMNSGIFDTDVAGPASEYTEVKPDAGKPDLQRREQTDERKRVGNEKATDNPISKSTALAFTPSKKEEDGMKQLHQTALAEQSAFDKGVDLVIIPATGEAKAVNQDIETGVKGEENKTQQVAENNKKLSKEDALIRMLNEGNDYASSAGSSLIQRNKEEGARKWNVGLMFSPSLTDERVNMGGGVTVAYHISKKVSIGSGVSLVDLGFRQSSLNNSGGGVMMDSPAPASLNKESPMFNAKSLETRELTSVNTNLLALDIPIDIKYQVSKHFYASAGVSFFAVLNENRTNNFLTRTPTDRTMQNADGFAFSQPEFQVRSVSEQATETPYQGNGYSGFLNFSVGRRMPISNKIGVAVEPFIKIPVGGLSNQDMNLRYGGVRVITSF